MMQIFSNLKGTICKKKANAPTYYKYLT